MTTRCLVVLAFLLVGLGLPGSGLLERSEARPASLAGRTIIQPLQGELVIRNDDGLVSKSRVVARLVSNPRFARFKKLRSPDAVEGKLAFRRSIYAAGRTDRWFEEGELSTPAGVTSVTRGRVVIRTNRDGIRAHRSTYGGELETGERVVIRLRARKPGIVR